MVYLCLTELFEIELFFYIQPYVNKWLMFKWIFVLNSNTWKHLTVYKQIINRE